MVDHRDADLSGSTFRNVDLSGTRIRSAYLRDVVITDAWLKDVRIEGEVESLSVNGVDVAAYVEAQLAERHPELARLRPDDVEGLRQAWDEAIVRWDATVDRARRRPAEQLDERVDDEFSFIQTLRHLVMAFDRWLSGPVFGDPEPHFHPLGLPYEGADESETRWLDVDARPTLDEVLAVRRERQERLRAFLQTATQDDVQRVVASPNGGETTVLACAHVVLNEEWWHHHYATRDLSLLEQRG